MRRKRSRANTEQRFQDAVIELLAESGCAHLGVNLVAERAGFDKVLIYRYFGDLNGLLQRVAENRTWLPGADELPTNVSDKPEETLRELARQVSRRVRADAATHQLCIWRHAVKNPLTEQLSAEWKSLWKELAMILGAELDYEARQNWEKACALLGLATEAELMGEAIDLSALDAISEGLVTGKLKEDSYSSEEDRLPTNLL